MAPPAVAAIDKHLDLASQSSIVNTSTGKTLKLSVTASKNTSKGTSEPTAVGVILSTRLPYHRGETHGWRFEVPRASVSYRPSTGRGSINAGFGTYGTVNLTFVKTRQTTKQCAGGGSLTSIRGRLRGAIHFDTNTKAWGSVDDDSFAFDKPNIFTINKDCSPRETARCYTATTWNAPPGTGGTGYADISGTSKIEGGKRTTTITATRIVDLGTPAGTSRTDSLTAAAPAPATNGKDMTITTKSTGPLSGSAKILGRKAIDNRTTCHLNGQKRTEQYNGFYDFYAWKSPDGIRFNFKASSDVLSTKGGAAGWGRWTYN